MSAISTAPNWIYRPTLEVGEDIESEFQSWVNMIKFMPGALGPNGKPQVGSQQCMTVSALSFTEAEVEGKIEQFLQTMSRNEAIEILERCAIQASGITQGRNTNLRRRIGVKLSRIAFSPFDTRYTIYDNAVAVHRADAYPTIFLTVTILAWSSAKLVKKLVEISGTLYLAPTPYSS